MPLPIHLSRRAAIVAVVVATTAAAGGCASFQDQEQTADEGTFSAVPSVAYSPKVPSTPEQPDGPPPTGPCIDPNPAVIATCLASTSGVRPADGQGATTYVAERTTGKIILSKRYGPQRTVAKVDVDASGDGGLIDFELSPTWLEDQMIFALITTPSDNRVVRIAPTGSVKPILTGIPKGATGNMGSITFASPTRLIVATGDAGDPGASRDSSSLAGKILAVDDPNNATSRPEILASGLGSNVALCRDDADGRLFVADSGAAGDRLSLVAQKSLTPLWTWPDRPGLTGCATGSDWIAVSIAAKKRIDVFTKPSPASPTVAEPSQEDFSRSFGAIGRLSPVAGAAFQLATVNKTTSGARTVQTDDRVAIHIPQGGGAEDRT